MPRRPITRQRSTDVCPYCGQRYERWRGHGLSFAAAQAELMVENLAYVEETQDYSKPVRRAAILGRMHGSKLKAWQDEHLYWCAQEHDAKATVSIGEP